MVFMRVFFAYINFHYVYGHINVSSTNNFLAMINVPFQGYVGSCEDLLSGIINCCQVTRFSMSSIGLKCVWDERFFHDQVFISLDPSKHSHGRKMVV